MVELVFLIVLGTTVWVGYDSSTNKITTSDGPYSLANGAVGWVLVCIFLWIIAFPAYLIRRGKLMGNRKPVAQAAVTTPPANLAAELEKLAALRASGHLSEGDFERAKGKLLS
ncbi:SHOCT domain-containing protein [Deinococcus sp. SM5_A1]|uniref:SHOCT domain-containing protein n=1 Tax=Deinococcus sp. SM5_A1 TaxID=3379094 RepID=UPI003859E360